jgi:hypothetical protein
MEEKKSASLANGVPMNEEQIKFARELKQEEDRAARNRVFVMNMAGSPDSEGFVEKKKGVFKKFNVKAVASGLNYKGPVKIDGDVVSVRGMFGGIETFNLGRVEIG